MRMQPSIAPTVAFLACSLAMPPGASAQFPAQDMDRRTLGAAYSLAFRGQTITESEVASHEVLHQASLAYSPVPYLVLQAGIGMDRLSVAPHAQVRFRGDYGFSPSFGASVYSPFFAADVLRGTAGGHAYVMGSEDERGYHYSALVTNPFLGLIVSPTVFLDLTVGARLHLMGGTMKQPRAADGEDFGNNHIGRGYLSLNLKTPFEGAFLNLDLDLSPEVDMDWSNGPREASVAVTAGALLGWKGRSQPKQGTAKPTYFPAYPEMKERQKKMAEELE